MNAKGIEPFLAGKQAVSANQQHFFADSDT
jgi:hypothetical protein